MTKKMKRPERVGPVYRKIVLDANTGEVLNIIICREDYVSPQGILVDWQEGVTIGSIFKDGVLVQPTVVEQEPTEEELISAIERKILREQAEVRLTAMTDEEKRALLEKDK